MDLRQLASICVGWRKSEKLASACVRIWTRPQRKWAAKRNAWWTQVENMHRLASVFGQGFRFTFPWWLYLQQIQTIGGKQLVLMIPSKDIGVQFLGETRSDPPYSSWKHWSSQFTRLTLCTRTIHLTCSAIHVAPVSLPVTCLLLFISFLILNIPRARLWMIFNKSYTVSVVCNSLL